MKAVVVRAPMLFGLEDVPIPEIPEGGMLLKVKACGLCGSDLRTLRSGHRKVTLPWIIGHELCAEVVELGHGYKEPWQKKELLAVGPLVYCGECEFCHTERSSFVTITRRSPKSGRGDLLSILRFPKPASSGARSRLYRKVSIPRSRPLPSRSPRVSMPRKKGRLVRETPLRSSAPARWVVSTPAWRAQMGHREFSSRIFPGTASRWHRRSSRMP